MKENKIICPFCGSENIEDYKDGYHCKECDWLFDDEEIERQELRHQISPLLEGTSEDAPKEIDFLLPSVEEEACGLSSLELPTIDKIFEVEGEGTMWYHFKGENGLCGGEPTWHDLDELSIVDLKALLDYLRKR